MDSVVISPAERKKRAVVLVAEVFVVHVVQVDGSRAADDAHGHRVGAFPMLVETAMLALRQALLSTSRRTGRGAPTGLESMPTPGAAAVPVVAEPAEES